MPESVALVGALGLFLIGMAVLVMFLRVEECDHCSHCQQARREKARRQREANERYFTEMGWPRPRKKEEPPRDEPPES